MKKLFSLSNILLSISAFILTTLPSLASEADLVVPNIKNTSIDSYIPDYLYKEKELREEFFFI